MSECFRLFEKTEYLILSPSWQGTHDVAQTDFEREVFLLCLPPKYWQLKAQTVMSSSHGLCAASYEKKWKMLNVRG